MLSNEYFLAKFRFDTAENAPAKNVQNLQNFARKIAKFAIRPLSLRGYRGHAAPAGRGTPRGAPARRSRGRRRRRAVHWFCQFLANLQQNIARFRLYRLRFLQQNMRFTAFFKIYQIIKLNVLKFGKICKFCDICKILLNFLKNC